MPRDPQGAGTRTETKVEWRPVCRRTLKDGSVHEWFPCVEGTEQQAREVAQEIRAAFGWDAFAIERIETTTTITREEL